MPDQKTYLSSTDAAYPSASSLFDRCGQVFFYESRILRAIKEEKSQEVLTVINSDFFKGLVRDGIFPRTEISDINIEGYSLVLEHEKITAVQPADWTYTRLYDSALFLFDLEKKTKENGFCLHDAYFYNIGFKNNRPMAFDLGIFDPDPDGWVHQIKYRYLCFLPLALMFLKEEISARMLLAKVEVGFSCESRYVNSFLVLEMLYLRNLDRYGRHKFPAMLLTGFCYARFAFSNKYRKKIRDDSYKMMLNGDLVARIFKKSYGKLEAEMEKSISAAIDSRKELYSRIYSGIRKNCPDCRTILDGSEDMSFLVYMTQESSDYEKMLYLNDNHKVADIYYRIAKEKYPIIEPYCGNFLSFVSHQYCPDKFRSDAVITVSNPERPIRFDGYFSLIKNFTDKYLIMNYNPSKDKGNKTDEIRTEMSRQFTILDEITFDGNVCFIGKRSDLA